MTEQPPPLDYATPSKSSPGWRRFKNALHVAAGMFSSFAILFITVFFGAASAFERDRAEWWAGPAVLLVLVAMAFFAFSMRRRSPFYSVGLWIGTGLGLLLAGLCILPVIV